MFKPALILSAVLTAGIASAADPLTDAMQQAFSEYGRENTVVITRSNKRANLFNQAIRERILFHENDNIL